METSALGWPPWSIKFWYLQSNLAKTNLKGMAKMVRLNESSPYPEQATTAACQSYPCKGRKTLPKNFSFEMAVVLSVRTEKARVIRTFGAEGPEKMFVLVKVRVTVVRLNQIFLTRLNAWPTICTENVRTNELFVWSEFVLTMFDCIDLWTILHAYALTWFLQIHRYQNVIIDQGGHPNALVSMVTTLCETRIIIITFHRTWNSHIHFLTNNDNSSKSSVISCGLRRQLTTHRRTLWCCGLVLRTMDSPRMHRLKNLGQ